MLAQDRARASNISDLAAGNLQTITSEMVGQASAMGAPAARAILGETIELLSTWLGNVIDLLEPDVVVIGGGVASALKPFFPQMQAGLPGFCVNSRGCEIPVLPARYGEDAGIAGGGALGSRVPAGMQVS